MRALILLATAFLLAGCSITGDDGGSSVEPGQLGKLVLQPSDLPRAFFRFDEGRQGAVDSRGEPGRFGRQGGWKARYRRTGTAETKGPLVVASLVDLFESDDGAEEELTALRTGRSGEGLAWKTVDPPRLGEEAVALTSEQGTGSGRVRFFLVAWREGSVTASLAVNGFADGLELEDVVELAQKQARRIEDAA